MLGADHGLNRVHGCGRQLFVGIERSPPQGPRRERKGVAVSASTTVTFSGRKPSTALATSCGIACCASFESVPPRVFTITAAFDSCSCR